MTVPLVQGSLRYAYKIGNVPSDRSQKNAAEGATFTAAVLPLIHACSPLSAATISANQKFGLYDAGTYPDFAKVKEAFEDTYACLGITCKQVGSLASEYPEGGSAVAACTTHEPIAGYYPGSSVVEHNKIDLDQKAMETALGDGNFTLAKKWYAEGGNSVSKGAFRTIKGFSTGAQGKMYNNCAGCPYKHYSMFYEYYGDFSYADKWVSAALDGTSMTFSSGKHGPNDFSALGVAARKEAVKKGTAYMNVWMYAVREFEDAIDDCLTCTSACNEFSENYDSVHAWDEGVAFYAGTREGMELGGNGDGVLVYRLAEKRCKNFGTCGVDGDEASGTSHVNHELFKLFAEGRDILHRGECDQARPIVDKIVSVMTVPLVQGSLRYAYKIGNVPSDRSQKNAAEGATFTAAVLPLIHACSPLSAATISANQKFGLYDAGTYPDFAKVKEAFEDTYACLDITCKQVGSLKAEFQGDGGCYNTQTHQTTCEYDGASTDTCTGMWITSCSAAGYSCCSSGPIEACTTHEPIAGYYPGSSVVEHNKIDLDQKAMETALGDGDFTLAKKWYAEGGNSVSKGAFRTIKGFSTGAQGKMYDNCAGCPYKHYSMFYNYYRDFDYADKWVSAALDGTEADFSLYGDADFRGTDFATRREAVKKGTA